MSLLYLTFRSGLRDHVLLTFLATAVFSIRDETHKVRVKCNT